MNDTTNGHQADTPIFDALAQHAPDAVLAEVEEAETADSTSADATPEQSATPQGADPQGTDPQGAGRLGEDPAGTDLPPDAAARDAARREQAATGDGTLNADEFRTITRGVTPEEKAAVIAVLTRVRAEETERVKRVERREHQPWARSQRVPEGIGDLLADG